MSKPQFITEEQFAEMVKGMKDRAKGGVVGTRSDKRRCIDLAYGASRKTKTDTDQAGSNPVPSLTILTVTLHGQLCSGKNQIRMSWKNGTMHKYPNKTFSNWRAKAKLELLAQGIPATPMTEPVVLTCHYTPGDLRTRDVTGQLDALFHLLCYAKVLKDDGLIYEQHWFRLPLNRKAPQVTLQIQPWEERS